MVFKICYLILVFLIYSVIGYITEVICVSLDNKKIVFSRGYLIGPYLPIFGIGSLIITLFLHRYKNDILALFIMATVFCCTLEYFTSLILEKIFKLRWWDYSDKKFNLNGRICLETGVLFGLGGIFIIKVFNPIIFMLLGNFSETSIVVITIILGIIMLLDFILSTYTIIKLKIDTNKYINKDATSVVKEKVKKSLRKYRYFYIRLFRAFPELSKENSSILKIVDIINKRKRK